MKNKVQLMSDWVEGWRRAHRGRVSENAVLGTLEATFLHTVLRFSAKPCAVDEQRRNALSEYSLSTG